jgi:hypothetical protein
MFTLGFMITPLPILEPKARNNRTFRPLIGLKGFTKNSTLIINQILRFTSEAPGEYHSLLNLDKSTLRVLKAGLSITFII